MVAPHKAIIPVLGPGPGPNPKPTFNIEIIITA